VHFPQIKRKFGPVWGKTDRPRTMGRPVGAVFYPPTPNRDIRDIWGGMLEKLQVASGYRVR
jgi:hypothetical protein